MGENYFKVRSLSAFILTNYMLLCSSFYVFIISLYTGKLNRICS